MPPLPLQPQLLSITWQRWTVNLAPPNSLEAVQASLEAGARCIEMDVTALADSDYLLVHDPELESETSGRGLVAECSAEQARGLMIKHQGVHDSLPRPPC